MARLDRLKRLAHGSCPASTILYGRRYLAFEPDNWLAWIFLGEALVEVARHEEAEQAFAKALEFCPLEKRHIPLCQVGHLFGKAGDWEQAAHWYRRSIEARPSRVSAYIYLGSLLAEQGRFSEAEEILRQAIECLEGCVDEAYFILGLVLRSLERFQEAAECFRDAIRLNSDYRVAREALRDVERCLKIKKQPG